MGRGRRWGWGRCRRPVKVSQYVLSKMAVERDLLQLVAALFERHCVLTPVLLWVASRRPGR